MYLALATQLEAGWEITVILVCFFWCVVHDLGDMIIRAQGQSGCNLKPSLSETQLGAAVLSKMPVPSTCVLCSPPDHKSYKKVWGYELTESLLPCHLATTTAFWPSPLMSMAFHPENSRLKVTFINRLVFHAYSHFSRHGLSHAPALLWSISTCL